MTLIEVAVASFLFALMAVSTLTALIQTRKISENNVAQATAITIAQSIIEQIQITSWDTLADTTILTLPLKFTSKDSNNLSSILPASLPWAVDAVTFSSLGTAQGVLVDMDYKTGSTLIRSARYMKMRVNLQRTPHASDDNIEFILTYSWQPPSGNGRAAAPYVTREIRTIRSKATSY